VSYAELLRDPRWQRKRLEVMEAADFTCVECGDKTTTLNVHHTYYEKGRKPWEYDARDLRCLCEPCHEETTQFLALAYQFLGRLSLDDLALAVKRLGDEMEARERAKGPVPVKRPHADPEVAAAQSRMAEIDFLLPSASSDDKDAMTREKMALVDLVRAKGVVRWKTLR
jgi:hypothetical protein